MGIVDSANRVIVAVVRVAPAEEGPGRLETWAFDAGKNTWTPMKPKRERKSASSRKPASHSSPSSRPTPRESSSRRSKSPLSLPGRDSSASAVRKA